MASCFDSESEGDRKQLKHTQNPPSQSLVDFSDELLPEYTDTPAGGRTYYCITPTSVFTCVGIIKPCMFDGVVHTTLGTTIRKVSRNVFHGCSTEGQLAEMTARLALMWAKHLHAASFISLLWHFYFSACPTLASCLFWDRACKLLSSS